MGSIQAEQFHFLWNSSIICGTASQNRGTAPQKVEQVLKAGHSSRNCGTVSQIVEQFHKKHVISRYETVYHLRIIS